MFTYTKMEQMSDGVMFYNISLNRPIGDFQEDEIFPWAFLSFSEPIMTLGLTIDTDEQISVEYDFDFFDNTMKYHLY